MFCHLAGPHAVNRGPVGPVGGQNGIPWRNPVAWPLVPDLLAQLDEDPGSRLIWLGRFGRRSILVSESTKITRHPDWGPLLALQLAWALRLCGDSIASDRWILVAHRLDPGLGLIPDPWGLWTDQSASGNSPLAAEEQQRARDLLELLRSMRWQQPCFPFTPLPDWRGDWQDDQLDGFALLLAGTAIEQQPSLQQALLAAVGEQELAADADAALRWWSFLAEAWPEWGHPRLKSADLALAKGDLRCCGHWLANPSADLEASPWFFDLAARLALASGDLAAAMELWGRAMAMVEHDSSGQDLAELFRQRRRDARRTQGPDFVRSLRRSGDVAAAVELLALLIQQDPQWQPFNALGQELSSLEGALSPAEAAPKQAGNTGSASNPGPAVKSSQAGGLVTGSSIERFSAFLERSSPQANLSMPPASQGLSPEALAGILSRAEGRAALLD